MCGDVRPEAAAEVGARLRDRLVGDGILLPDLDAEGAHPPGPAAHRATSGPECAPDPAATAQLIVGRNIFWSEWGHNLFCPQCRYTVEPEDDEALAAMEQWQRGEPAGDVGCPDCELRQPLTDWDSDWGYGNLGIEFWHWPSLSYAFVHWVGRLTGSRVTVAHGGRG